MAGARTLREGYRLFEREAPAAVILDLNLPDGDGVEFCRRIRSAPGTGAGTAILILFGGLSLWVYIILWIIIPKAPAQLNP